MTEPVADDADRPTPTWRLLRGPFLRYFVGNFTSNLGTWFQDIAAAILIFQLTGSAALVGGVVVCGYGASLVLSPLGGALADRFDRRTLLIITHLSQGLAAATLAGLAFAGLLNVVVIFVIAAIIGAGRAINNPTLQAMLPSLVAPKDIAGATALQAVTFTVARALGPVLGALLITFAGPAPAFAVNAASFFAFAIILTTLTLPASIRSRIAGGFRTALRYVRARPELAILLLCCTAIGMSTDPVITLGPVLARRFGQDESFAGWIVSAFGFGSVLAAPLAARVRRWIGPRRTGVLSMVVIALSLWVVSLSPWLPMALAAFAVAGFWFLVGNADLVASIQENVEDVVRGRVMALWSMGFLGSRPLAALLDGSISDLRGPRVAIAVLAGVIIVVAIASWLAFRRLDRR